MLNPFLLKFQVRVIREQKKPRWPVKKRVYSPKDIKAQDCALIKGLETKIHSINEGDIEYSNKIPDEEHKILWQADGT